MWSIAPRAEQGSFEARHAHENKADVAAELGIKRI
jgi:hypothetical protein